MPSHYLSTKVLDRFDAHKNCHLFIYNEPKNEMEIIDDNDDKMTITVQLRCLQSNTQVNISLLLCIQIHKFLYN